MCSMESKNLPDTGQALQMMEVFEKALMAQSIEGLAGKVLPELGTIMKTSSAFLYIEDLRMSEPQFFQSGFLNTQGPLTGGAF